MLSIRRVVNFGHPLQRRGKRLSMSAQSALIDEQFDR